MIRTISTGDSMLSLWSSRTSCNNLWWIRLFRCNISPKKIVKLIKSILRMKCGKFRTKRYLFGSNQHFRSLFYHECLDRTTPMKFGRRFTSTSIFRRSLVRANCKLWCARLCSKERQLKNICARSKDLLMSSPVLEGRLVTKSTSMRFLKDFLPIMRWLSLLLRARSARLPLPKLRHYSTTVMRLALFVTTRKLNVLVLLHWTILRDIRTLIHTNLLIPVVFVVRMVAAVVTMVVLVTTVALVVALVAVVVVPEKVMVVADLPTFSARLS